MQGATGAQGVKGDTGISGSVGSTGAAGANGTQGIQGEVGSTGTQGIKGDTGTSGSVGTAGAAGTNGTQGIQGIQGIKGDTGLTGSQGIQGDIGTSGSVGAAGANGTQGIQGIQGIKGDTGVAGISNSFYADIQQWTLNTDQPSAPAESELFAFLSINSSYTFEIILDGTFAPNTEDPMSIGIELQTTSTLASMDFRVFASDDTIYINGHGGRHISYLFIGFIHCGAELTDMKLIATDNYGTTLLNAFHISGKALFNKVGSIG